MMNKKIYIEFDNIDLKNISESIYDLFIKNNYNAILLDSNLSINDNNSFVLSNKINNDNSNAIEIIYSLNSDDTLAKTLANNLEKTVSVSKYYQLRSTSNTALDYYEVLRNTKNNQAIIIRYGKEILNNQNIPSIIYQTINEYLNSSNIYVVKSGDSLYKIAKEFNTTVDELKKINNLVSNNLSIGQKLIIPSNETSDINNQNLYTVKSGDSLYKIAKEFNTTVDELKKINNLSTNNLSIGQKLIIPNSLSNTIYVVKSGDSLYAIARRFNTTVDELKKVNNLKTNNLSIGQILLIPSSTNNNLSYTVLKGDSLYAIAKKFNTTVDELKKVNNLKTNNLSIGQKLIIP